jgi:hypothetical protein
MISLGAFAGFCREAATGNSPAFRRGDTLAPRRARQGAPGEELPPAVQVVAPFRPSKSLRISTKHCGWPLPSNRIPSPPRSCCASWVPIHVRTHSLWPYGKSGNRNARCFCWTTSRTRITKAHSCWLEQRGGSQRAGQSGVLQPARGTARPSRNCSARWTLTS